MSRPARQRLSVVPQVTAPTPDVIVSSVYREHDIHLAAERLHLSSVRLRAIPRIEAVAEWRAAELERFEAAISAMREALQ